MPNELSLDEIYSTSGQEKDEYHIDPNEQAVREREGAEIIQNEIKDPRNANVKEGLKKELARRAPGMKPAESDELSLDDIYGKAEAPAKPGKPAEKPTSTSYWDKAKKTGRQLGREAAQVGDMVFSAPAAAAGSIGEVILRADLARQGVNHAASSEAGRAFREEITQKGSPTWFEDIVSKFTPPDEKADETHVSKALNWLQGKIDQGGDAVDKVTGGTVNKDDVSGFVNGAMNAIGLKATRAAGNFFEAGARGALAKDATAAKQASEGHAPEAETPKPKVDYKEFLAAKGKEPPASLPKDAPAEKVRVNYKEWKEATDKAATETAEAVAKSREEAIAEQPINKQSGKASVDQLKGMAGLAVGAMAGAYLDEENPIVGGVLGAVFGGGVATGAISGAKRVYEGLRSGDPRVRINSITEARQYDEDAGLRYSVQAAKDLYEAVPKKEDLVAITRAIDEGKVGSLSKAHQEAARKLQTFYDEIGKAGMKEGVLDAVRENYITHVWDKSDQAAARSIFEPKNLGPSVGPNSVYAEARRFTTLAEGKAAGLVPKTENAANLALIYGRSMTTAIANKRMLDRLKGAKTEADEFLVRPAGKAPPNYVAINHPTLARVKVHPDIAPSLRFLFEQQDAHGVMAGLNALNTALKRNAVSFSLFHAKALADAMLGAVNNPLLVGKVVAQASLPKIFGRNRYLDQLRKGGPGDLPDRALKAGVRFSYENMESVDADVGNGFYKTMNDVQQALDRKLGPVAGMPIKAYMRINHAFDNFMWARLHTAMKLEVFAAKSEALMENTARDKTPLSQEAADRIAADYANTIFGGLNWQRMAESVNNRFGRDMALSAFSPKGRRGLQLAMFAPDWTLSTSMAFTKAFGKGTGIKGLFGAKTAADLYRQQLARSAFYYLTIGNALNFHFTGHYLWDNKDPTYVELGDGRKMQLSKHFMEPFHWMDRPGQQALNKMGQIPAEGLEQIEGREYLSTKGAPPMKNRLSHAAKKFLPIGAGQFENGVGPGVAGALGFPIYGRTADQKAADKKARREEAFKKRMQTYRKNSGLDQQ